MLLGVWLSGGLFMSVAAVASGSEFIGGTGVWRLIVIALSVIPVVTFVLASYDGSLLALLAVTLGSLIFCGVHATLTLWNADATGSSAAAKGPESNRDAKAA